MNDLPLIHPERSTTAFRPFKAWNHFRQLVADKEDTEQVFHIINSLRGKNFSREGKKFFATDVGRKVVETSEYLPDLLDQHDWLHEMPEGSLGRTYVEFMEREGLTANGLVEEYDKFRDRAEKFDDQLEIYSNRLRDTHDLFHVLTGYGRDALGEQALLAFSYSQNKNLGVIFIAYAGAMHLRGEIKERYDFEVPLISVVNEGKRLGKIAKKIAHQDLIELLPRPIGEVREMLGLEEPKAYYQALETMRANGVDPYDLLGENADKQDIPVELAQAA